MLSGLSQTKTVYLSLTPATPRIVNIAYIWSLEK